MDTRYFTFFVLWIHFVLKIHTEMVGIDNCPFTAPQEGTICSRTNSAMCRPDLGTEAAIHAVKSMFSRSEIEACY